MENHHKFWTEEEEKILILEVRNNNSLEEIASNHKRTIGAITSRVNLLSRKMFEEGKTAEEIASIMNLKAEYVKIALENMAQKNIVKKVTSKDKLILNELIEIKNLLKSIDEKLKI